MVQRLKDRVVIVTGGASGIGLAFAKGLAGEAAHVLVADYDERALAEARAECESLGLQIECTVTDVTSRESCNAMAQRALGMWGRIDALVNSAAVYEAAPFDQIDEDDWDRMYAVNVKGSWLATLAVQPTMQAAGKGKIVNIGSQTFFSGWPHYAHYVGTKGAVVGMTRALAVELGEQGIRVNCLAPGLTMTQKALVDVERSILPGQVEQWVDDHVAGQCIRHPGYPEDLIGALLFLTTDDSDFLTGQTLLVDGGWAKH